MFAYVVGLCAACNHVIGFHPHKVPSLMINGKKEPICEGCAKRWNELHPAEAKPILEGAYEPFDESEL